MSGAQAAFNDRAEALRAELAAAVGAPLDAISAAQGASLLLFREVGARLQPGGWATGLPGFSGLSELRGLPGLPGTVDAVTGFAALVALGEGAGLPAAIGWGNVASVLARAADRRDPAAIDSDGVAAWAATCLEQPPLAGAWTGSVGPDFRRTTCCLITTRGESGCVDCPRRTPVRHDEAVADAELDRSPDLDLDLERAERTGIGEAVYGPGKSPETCAAAVAGLIGGTRGPVLLTRADDAQRDAAEAGSPGGTRVGDLVYWRAAAPVAATVLILTAGTADLAVADEARGTLLAYGVKADVIPDVGVAGLHRVLAHRERLRSADAVVVIAGMEGALPSVVAGLTAAPVIAVPTSTGYGAGLEGVTALLGMLASCSPGISVVGIDNGFGAACAVLRLLRVGAAAGPTSSGSTASEPGS